MEKNANFSLSTDAMYNGASEFGNQQGYWKFLLCSKKLVVCPRVKKLLDMPRLKTSRQKCVLNMLAFGQLLKLMREYQYILQRGGQFDITIRIVTHAHQLKWLRITGMPYQRRWGAIDQIIGLVEDVTQRIMEEKLCIAVVSHELRSPLTIIKLNNQQALKILINDGDQRPAKLLDRVDEHINGITQILDEYLTYPIDEARLPQLNPSIFDLNRIIETVLCEMRTANPSHRFIRNDAQPVWIKADRYKISQVLINYLTNAVNFSPAGSRIIIGMRPRPTLIEVTVCDEGIGIAEGEEQNIFKKYYRSKTSGRQRTGKGLGLYLVKKIIQLHGGQVCAESSGCRGSVFSFSLPLNQQELPETLTDTWNKSTPLSYP